MAATRTSEKVTPGREAWGLIFQIAMSNRAKLHAGLGNLGLTFPQAHVLRLVSPDQPKPMSEIAEWLLCDASNVTGLADRLEARGLVERQSDPADRRIKVIALTAEGAEMRDRVLGLWSTPPAEIESLSVADQKALLGIARRALGH